MTTRSERSSAPLPADGTVLVVGGSLAGLRAAETLRSEGFAGRLVMIGDELHLPYDRPPLSKQVLAGTWPPERAMLIDRLKLDELRLEQLFGHRAVSLDVAARSVTLDDGSTQTADGIVLATGARPRTLRGLEGNEGMFVLRTLDDATRIRDRLEGLGTGARIVVVGAGFIGSEVASTCAALGCRVTVVEPLAVPLAPSLGAEVGAACAQLHRSHGVDLMTGVGVVQAHAPGAGDPAPAGRAGRVELTDGSSLAADVVVVGIGVVPAVDWLEDSGLTIGDGVVCDATLFAADGIVAAGDMARWCWRHGGDEELVRIEHWQVAAEEGVAAARNLLVGRAAAQPFDPVPYFWSDQYGLRIQVLGHPAPTDEVAIVEGTLSDEKFVALYGRAGRLTAALAISRPRQLMGYRPLLASGVSWDEALAHAAG